MCVCEAKRDVRWNVIRPSKELALAEFNPVLVVFLFGRKKWLRGIMYSSLRCLTI